MTDEDSRPAEPAEQADEDSDTEGHSLLMAELGRTLVRDRDREVQRSLREARMRDESKDKKNRSFFRR